MIKDDELIEKYSEIWENNSNNIKKELGSEPVSNEKHLKTKIKPYKGKSKQIFTIMVDSVFRTSKNYYLQVFLEEWKYVVKDKKMP